MTEEEDWSKVTMRALNAVYPQRPHS